jgi:cell division protein FtsW
VPIRQRFDRLLIAAVFLQLGVGLAILASASWLIATERYGRPGSYFFTWQAATGMIGLGLLVICMHLRKSLLVDRRLIAVALGSSWLLLVVAFLQSPVAATHRWVSIGGLSLQPSVLARVALILVSAILLVEARSEGWPVRRLGILAALCVATTLVVALQPDLGSAALMLVAIGAMAFVAGMPLRLMALPAALGAVALVVAIVASPYRLARVRAFFDADSAAAASWQSEQSLIAIGSGGAFGVGYGSGLQKLFFLPEPHTDFIFAITGEELGLVGMTVLLILSAVIAWRGMVIASRLEDSRLALLAFGLTVAFAAQSLVHMAVCLNLLPPKGIPLPFVSYGKTELLVSLMSVGILLNLSREVGS